MTVSGDAQIAWSGVRAVVLDLDGTLYRQRPLRLGIATELAAGLLVGRVSFKTLRAILFFRRLRERLAEHEAQDAAWRQYVDTAKAFDLSPTEVRDIVAEWMQRRPLKYLSMSAIRPARDFVLELKKRGFKTAVLSDYPTHAKLARLGIEVDAQGCTLDTEGFMLKPHPGALLDMLRRLEVLPENTLVVGDRDRRDGEMAHRAGCAYHRAHSARCFRKLLASLDQHHGALA